MPEFNLSAMKSEELIAVTIQVQGTLLSLSRIVPKQIGCEHDEPFQRQVIVESLSK